MLNFRHETETVSESIAGYWRGVVVKLPNI